MTTEITVPRLAPMMSKLKRMHHRKYARIRDEWAFEIRSLTKAKHEGSVNISFTRYSTAMPDWDNLYASFKVIGDALVSNGIIEDDNMSIVKDLDANWGKVSKRKFQRTEIKIEDV